MCAGCAVAIGNNNEGGVATFTNRGSYVDVWAPGVNVFTTDFGPGTSFSCPLVAGVIAMIWSAV